MPARTQPPTAAIGPGAALAAWVGVLVALNVTGHPLVAAAAFASLAWLALRAGMWRLVLMSVVVGVTLLAAVPGVAVADGSWHLAYADGAWALPTDLAGWVRLGAGACRVPAQVLATVLLALVPARLVLDGAARVSPRAALLGGLAARLRPLLVRDLRLVRDELESRGVRMGRGVPVAERLRGAAALWEAAVSGLLDRAFGTAAALDTRGYGQARPTVGGMLDPSLDDGVRRSAARDGGIVLVALAIIATVVAGRATGALLAPPFQSLASAPQATTAAAVLAAALFVALAVAVVVGGDDASRAPATDARATQPHGSRTPTLRNDATLRVAGVSMRHAHAAHPSLVDADLEVAPGELVVLAGASGSGKSTLLDVVTGVAPRTTGGTRRGTIRLGEHVLGSVRPAGGASIAAVLQDPESQVLVGLVAEEVAFGPRHRGLPLAEVTARVGSALDRLDVRHLALRDCATLSGGELQRVLLAAAIALEPALLVLDEPTSQVDATSEARFWDAVDGVRRDLGIAVLVAEHRLEHLLTRADRVVVVHGGRIVADVPPAHLAQAAPGLLVDAYAGLVPAPVERGAGPRLAFAFDRVAVGAPRDV
ncbi:MAG: transporter related, partial [Thermoleophilia bacterium]|nr:transporter related [Thermoleophilia bacterium]